MLNCRVDVTLLGGILGQVLGWNVQNGWLITTWWGRGHTWSHLQRECKNFTKILGSDFMSSRKTQLGRNLLDGKPAFQEERSGRSVWLSQADVWWGVHSHKEERGRKGRRKGGKEEGPEEGTQWARKLSQVSKGQVQGSLWASQRCRWMTVSRKDGSSLLNKSSRETGQHWLWIVNNSKETSGQRCLEPQGS